MDIFNNFFGKIRNLFLCNKKRKRNEIDMHLEENVFFAAKKRRMDHSLTLNTSFKRSYSLNGAIENKFNQSLQLLKRNSFNISVIRDQANSLKRSFKKKNNIEEMEIENLYKSDDYFNNQHPASHFSFNNRLDNLETRKNLLEYRDRPEIILKTPEDEKEATYPFNEMSPFRVVQSDAAEFQINFESEYAFLKNKFNKNGEIHNYPVIPFEDFKMAKRYIIF
jgi:hypothetical protein